MKKVIYRRISLANYASSILDKKCGQFYTFLLTGNPPCELGTMVAPPPPLPGQCCLVGSKNVPSTLQHCFSCGGGGSVLSEPGFSILNLDMQGTFFLTFLSKIAALIFLKMTKMCFVYDRLLEPSKFTFSFSYENFQIKETVRKNKNAWPQYQTKSFQPLSCLTQCGYAWSVGTVNLKRLLSNKSLLDRIDFASSGTVIN